MPVQPEDFHRAPASSFGRIRLGSAATQLVLLHVGAFLLDRILIHFHVYYVAADTAAPQPPLIGMGPFSIGMAFLNREVWRCLTWPFVHVSAVHLLINMIGLHFFAPVLESHFGTKRFVAFYILCSIGALLAYTVMWGTHQLIPNPWIPMYSASGPVLAVLIAAAHVSPNASALIYGIIPIKLRTLALGLTALTLYGEFHYANSELPVGVIQTGGAVAHLGSAAVALLLIRVPQWVRILEFHPFRRPPPF